MSQLRKFFEGCVQVAEGIDKASTILSSRGGGQPQSQDRRVIDVAGSEVPRHPQHFDPYGGGGVGYAAQPPAPSPQRGGLQVQHHNVVNIEQRVAYIVEMIGKGRDDPHVRQFAVQTISKRCGDRWCNKEGDYWAEVQSVFLALRQEYRYCLDTYGKDLFQHPARTLEFGGGDCDDATILLCSALGAIGYPTKCRVIQTQGKDDWNHIYAMCGVPPHGDVKWVPLDLSVSDKPPGWQPPPEMVVRFKDFDVPVR